MTARLIRRSDLSTLWENDMNVLRYKIQGVDTRCNKFDTGNRGGNKRSSAHIQDDGYVLREVAYQVCLHEIPRLKALSISRG